MIRFLSARDRQPLTARLPVAARLDDGPLTERTPDFFNDDGAGSWCPFPAIPRARRGTTPMELPAGAAATAAPGPLPLPDKPSIAVLPFQNMSGDPEQEYFADGMAEEIITALWRIRWLFVIARNSSFTYKDQGVDVKPVGRELQG